jgi:hypothetical protein
MANEFAINNKSPAFVACPSRDTVGYQATLLADLAGYSDGLLINMDAASDWVSDAGAGGTQAIDLDGVNDAIGLPIIPFAGGWSLSIWFKWASLSGLTFAFAARDANRVYIGQNAGNVYVRVGSDSGDIGSSTPLALNTWHNLITSIASDGLSYSAWCDGTALGSRSTTLSTPAACGIGAFFSGTNAPASGFASGRFDDLRIWNRDPLDDSDATALWASGSGRAKIVSPGGTSGFTGLSGVGRLGT